MERQSDREGVRRAYGALFAQVAAVLFAADPIGINFGSNTDEYDPEVGTILPRLHECHSTEDGQEVVHQEFVRWFDPTTAGSLTKYLDTAAQIWQLWQQFLAQNRP